MRGWIACLLVVSACGPEPMVVESTSEAAKHHKDAGTVQTPMFYTAGAIGGPVQTSFSASQSQEVYFWVGVSGAAHVEVFYSGNAYVVYDGTSPGWFAMPVAGTYISQFSMTGTWTTNAFVNGLEVGTENFEVTP